jgi:hypothetical protein
VISTRNYLNEEKQRMTEISYKYNSIILRPKSFHMDCPGIEFDVVPLIY